jgi:GrpB-like predicted nucleotidyltransferase (UPF0157 family)
MSGPHRDQPVSVVPYDPSWPERFERERELLAGALAPWLVGEIRHVGSTAVPGLAAKPVIDILAGVRDLPSSVGALDALAELEYKYAPYRAREMHWFCKPDPALRTHHLHLVPVGAPRYEAELAFRDLLRENRRVADAYATLKRELAVRYRDDREAYTQAKRQFIETALTPPPAAPKG